MGTPWALIDVPQKQMLARQPIEQIQQCIHMHIAVIVHLCASSLSVSLSLRVGPGRVPVGARRALIDFIQKEILVGQLAEQVQQRIHKHIAVSIYL